MRYQALLDPFSEFRSGQAAAGNGQDDLLLLIHCRVDFVAVEDEQHFHSRVTNALVAIYKRMILDKRVAQGSGLRR